MKRLSSPIVAGTLALAAVAALTAAARAGDPVGGAPPSPVGPVAGCVPGAGDCFDDHGGPGCEWAPCCSAVCAIMPECCTDAWDELCVEMAGELCERPPACLVSLTPCDSVGRRGGCADLGCCELVCAVDPFCCGSTWDSLCAAAATETCGASAGNGLVFDRIDEVEPCGEPPVNNGCDQPDGPALYTDLGLGQSWTARTWARGRRDVDWYRLDLASPATIRADVASEFPAEVSVITGDCVGGFTAIAAVNVPAGTTGGVDATLPAGEFFVVVTPGRDGRPILRGMPCTDDLPDVVRTYFDRYRITVRPALVP